MHDSRNESRERNKFGPYHKTPTASQTAILTKGDRDLLSMRKASHINEEDLHLNRKSGIGEPE